MDAGLLIGYYKLLGIDKFKEQGMQIVGDA